MKAPILLTGFDPFDGADHNPSWLAAAGLHGLELDGYSVVCEQLPTVFELAVARVQQLLDSLRPCVYLGLGLARSRRCLSLERIAVNLRDARIPDNRGDQPEDLPVVAGAPAAYWATVPVKAMRRAIEAAGYPAELSLSAGTFVCNAVFFAALHRAETTRVGFLHVPPLELLSSADCRAALTAAIRQSLPPGG